MNCPPIGDELGLVGYWNFEEVNDQTVLDLSVNVNSGTINGASYSEETPEQLCQISSCSSLKKRWDRWTQGLGRDL